VPGTNLTREEAATRAALVTVDRQDVDLDVTTGSETFSTRSTIHFSCAHPGAETFVDFVGAWRGEGVVGTWPSKIEMTWAPIIDGRFASGGTPSTVVPPPFPAVAALL